MSEPNKKRTDEERAFALDMLKLMRELEQLRERAQNDTIRQNLQEALDQMVACLPPDVKAILWAN